MLTVSADLGATPVKKRKRESCNQVLFSQFFKQILSILEYITSFKDFKAQVLELLSEEKDFLR